MVTLTLVASYMEIVKSAVGVSTPSLTTLTVKGVEPAETSLGIVH